MPTTHRYSFFSDLPPVPPNCKWLLLLPTVTLGVVGAACIPHFALGLAIGVCSFIMSNILLMILANMMSLDLSNDSIYSDELRQNITYGTLFAPLMEELLFRGILQPLLLLMIGALFSLSLTELFSETTFELFSFLVCCTLLDMLKFGILLLLIAVILPVLPQVLTIAGFGAGINAASIGAVCATAILFGAIHLPNAHDLSGLQAINATLFGVALGLLALQYGLWVPIAAHIMNNTLATIHLFLEDEFELQKQPESMMAPSIA